MSAAVVDRSRSLVAVSSEMSALKQSQAHHEHEYTIKRVYSSPALTSGKELPYVTYNNRAGPFKRYRRDYDLNEDYWWDRRYHTSPVFWPPHAWPNRHYRQSDAAYGYWWHYPALTYYPRYDRHSFQNQGDPLYAKRYRDPYYDRPLWNPARPWAQDMVEPKRVLDMYKKNIIDFDSVQRNWLAPYSWERRWNEYKEPYQQQTWTTSPRRYFFSYDT